MNIRINEWRGTYTLTVVEGDDEIGIGDCVWHDRRQAEMAAEDLYCRVLAHDELIEAGEIQAAGFARWPDVARKEGHGACFNFMGVQ